MTMPDTPDKEQKQALTDLLESIALEEIALAHFINAEAEKLQETIRMIKNKNICPLEAIELQKSIIKSMRLPIKKQLLLQFKLEDILEAKERLEKNT